MSCKKWDMTCPKCGQKVMYWPNCSPSTATDCNNHVWLMRKDGFKQFLHVHCPEAKEKSNDKGN